ncbi:galactinol synthase 2-like [Pyrus ussuriensis x Pyrus communis]|uniref:Galactinol synthase 2-like n=1 Tax=Pyrus ussuriensis x Pyrus communis TaxID=2448454 RepID=A0A5N5FVF9_9ROSA|nr:galactinol synthase 2-like [Pyrus ussuriensis x Pyrus communis]
MFGQRFLWRRLLRPQHSSPRDWRFRCVVELLLVDVLQEEDKLSFERQFDISFGDTLTLLMLWRHPEAVKLDKVKVVNYCANGSKPWSYTRKEENMEREDVKMLVNKWWEIYNAKAGKGTGQVNLQPVTSAKARKGTDQVNLQPEAGKGTCQVNLQPSEAAFSETGAVEFIFSPSAA